MVECRMWSEVVGKASPNEALMKMIPLYRKEKHVTLERVVRKELMSKEKQDSLKEQELKNYLWKKGQTYQLLKPASYVKAII